MKDLNALPEHLRATAITDGGDFAWPLDRAGEAIQALAEAGAVVLGVEAWSVDAEGVPAVVGWSSYDLGDYEADWAEAVARSKVEAEEGLATVFHTAGEEDVNYVGVDWVFPQPEEPVPA